MVSFNLGAPPPPRREWQPLVADDGSPTAMFVDLLQRFFSILDQQRTGYLWPETFSSFLDVQGFLFEHNVWKSQHKPVFGGQPVDNADCELKMAYENFGFEHAVADRNPQRPFRLPQGIGGTPLLTFRGFIDIMTIETAFMPDRSFTALNRALQHYGVLQEFGPLPRSCLPAVAPAAIRSRVERVSREGRQRAQTMLDANAAQNAMAARGRQAALDSIDTVYIGGYVYRPGLI